MRWWILRVQAFVIAVTLNMALALSRTQLAMIMRSVERYGIGMGFVYLEMAYMNIYFAALIIVCALGMLGALLTEIGRRRQALALHVASGATPGDIYRLVMVRWALGASVLPAAVGVGLSSAVLWVLREGKVPLFGAETMFLPGDALLSLCAMAALCLLVAWYPAARASRVSVAQALAAE